MEHLSFLFSKLTMKFGLNSSFAQIGTWKKVITRTQTHEAQRPTSCSSLKNKWDRQ